MVRHERHSCPLPHEMVPDFSAVQLSLVRFSKLREEQGDPFLSVDVSLMLELVVPHISHELR